MSRYYSSCKNCNHDVTIKYFDFLWCGERFGKYRALRNIVKHNKKEHSDILTKSELKKANEAVRWLFMKFVLFAVLDLFVKIPLMIITLPLFLLKLGLDWLFDMVGDLW